MPLTKRYKAQFLKRFLRKLRVGILNAECTLRLHAFGKKLIVHVLHDHIRTLHALFGLLWFPIPEIGTGPFLVQSAECAGKGRFSGTVVSDNGNDISGRGLQGDAS